VALTHTEALRQLLEKMDEILAKEGSTRLVSTGPHQVRINLQGLIDKMQQVLDELESQSTTLTSIDNKDFATQTTLALVEGKDFSTQTTLEAARVLLNTISNIDFFLSGDTTDGGDLLNELQSIDQNWNILSLNQLNLAAILAAVLNNSTSGRQDTRNNFESGYALVADFDTTGIGGGTLIDVRIQPGGSEQLGRITIRVNYTGAGTNALIITIVDTSSGTVVKTIAFVAGWSGAQLHLPDMTSGPVLYNGPPFDMKSGHEIRFTLSGVAVADRFFIAVEGIARENTLPTIDTTNSTATITTTTDEHDVNAQN